jgi:hypothetical protein
MMRLVWVGYIMSGVPHITKEITRSEPFGFLQFPTSCNPPQLGSLRGHTQKRHVPRNVTQSNQRDKVEIVVFSPLGCILYPVKPESDLVDKSAAEPKGNISAGAAGGRSFPAGTGLDVKRPAVSGWRAIDKTEVVARLSVVHRLRLCGV